MTLTLSDLTCWLVSNGYQKVDGRPIKDGSYGSYLQTKERSWHFNDLAPDARSVVVTPGGGQVPGSPDATLTDMSIGFGVDDADRITGVVVGETYAGRVLAEAKQPPATTAEIETLLDTGKAIFAELCNAMDRGPTCPTSEELHQGVARFIAENPSTKDLWRGVELEAA